MGEFRMPSLGADMDEGTLVEWLVKPGDEVARGDVIAVVDTVKAAMDVEVFESGVIEKLLVEPGTTVSVGTPLALIAGGATATAPPPVAAEPPEAEPPDAEPAPARPTGRIESPLVRRLAEVRHVDLATVAGTGVDGTITRADVVGAAARAEAAVAAQSPPAPPTGVRASPLARRRAAELGVDLTSVVGTGPDGAVTDADVEAAGSGQTAPPQIPGPQIPEPRASAPQSPTAERVGRGAAMQKATGLLMARSKREIPHYYLTADIDLHRAVRWLADANAGRTVDQRLVPAALLLKATAVAARRVPEVNGFWVDDAFTAAGSVHLGVAISLRHGGLIAPAIHDADTLPVEELMARLRDLVARARTGRLRQSEMADPTITVTSLGDLGVGAVYGVIYPPQVAVVGFGRVEDRPRAVDGMLTVRPVVTATLAADHRVSDGHRGGRYLALVDELLQKPEEL